MYYWLSLTGVLFVLSCGDDRTALDLDTDPIPDPQSEGGCNSDNPCPPPYSCSSSSGGICQVKKLIGKATKRTITTATQGVSSATTTYDCAPTASLSSATNYDFCVPQINSGSAITQVWFATDPVRPGASSNTGTNPYIYNIMAKGYDSLDDWCMHQAQQSKNPDIRNIPSWTALLPAQPDTNTTDSKNVRAAFLKTLLTGAASTSPMQGYQFIGPGQKSQYSSLKNQFYDKHGESFPVADTKFVPWIGMARNYCPPLASNQQRCLSPSGDCGNSCLPQWGECVGACSGGALLCVLTCLKFLENPPAFTACVGGCALAAGVTCGPICTPILAECRCNQLSANQCEAYQEYKHSNVSGLVPSCGAGEFCCKSKNSYSALSSDTLTDRFVPNTTPLNAWSDSKFDSNKDSNTLYGILQTMPLDSKGNACSSSNQNSNGDANWGSIAPSGFDLFYDCGRIPPAAIQSNVQSGIVFNSNGSAQHEIICLANTEIPKG